MISGDWGMGMNDDSKAGGDSPMAFGGMLGYGGGKFSIQAGANYIDLKNDELSKPVSFGGNAAFTLIHKPESPLSVNVFAGAATYGVSDSSGTSQASFLSVPAGVGISFSPPSNGGLSFEIWGAPRGQWLQNSPEGGESSSYFAFGGSPAERTCPGFGATPRSMDHVQRDVGTES
jgi:hypothetical protein